MLRILICDDHMVVRRGLRAILVGRHKMAVVGEAANGAEAVALAQELRPDVILMDLSMPVMGGVEAIRAIRANQPEAHILVLTSFSEETQLAAALRAGALGYLMKDTSSDELLEAVEQVSRGNLWLPAVMAAKMMGAIQSQEQPKAAPEAPEGASSPASEPPQASLLTPERLAALDSLTDREKEVLDGIAQGLSNQEIAEALVIGINTVRTHVSNILAKLELENRTQAALFMKEKR